LDASLCFFSLVFGGKTARFSNISVAQEFRADVRLGGLPLS